MACVEVVLSSDLDDSLITAVVLRNGAVEAVAELPLSDSKVLSLSVVFESLSPNDEVVGLGVGPEFEGPCGKDVGLNVVPYPGGTPSVKPGVPESAT